MYSSISRWAAASILYAALYSFNFYMEVFQMQPKVIRLPIISPRYDSTRKCVCKEA